MGWFSSIMDNWFGIDPPADNSAAINKQNEILQQQTAQAKTDAAASLKAQTDANLLSAAAALPQSDSESARTARDNQKRKLMSGSSFGIGMPTQLGAPPVGFRLLSGQ